MKFKITVDKDKCIGCGACAAQCDNFELKETDEGYKAKPKESEVDKVGCNKDAAEACPVEAIKVKEIK